MIKYNIVTLDDNLAIGVYYRLYESVESTDYDLPSEPMNIEIEQLEFDGDLFELVLFIEAQKGNFMDLLECKLYELND